MKVSTLDSILKALLHYPKHHGLHWGWGPFDTDELIESQLRTISYQDVMEYGWPGSITAVAEDVDPYNAVIMISERYRKQDVPTSQTYLTSLNIPLSLVPFFERWREEILGEHPSILKPEIFEKDTASDH